MSTYDDGVDNCMIDHIIQFKHASHRQVLIY